MGRKRLEPGTSKKDKAFQVLNNLGINCTYEKMKEVFPLSENSYRTFLSLYRKEKGIVVKMGRKKRDEI